jgi:hypothetical protein
MKQIRLLTIAILLIATTSHAQINKGVKALGGNLSLTSTTEESPAEKYTNTSFSIAPSFMSVYKDNRAIGFILKYTHNETSYFQLKTNSYGAGIFLRQYKPLGKGFYVFAQESLNFDADQYKSVLSSDTIIVTTAKTKTISVTVNPGLAFDVSKKFQLELLFFNNLLSAGYSHTDTQPGNLSEPIFKQNSFFINTNLNTSQLTSLNIGAKIFFGR